MEQLKRLSSSESIDGRRIEAVNMFVYSVWQMLTFADIFHSEVPYPLRRNAYVQRPFLNSSRMAIRRSISLLPSYSLMKKPLRFKGRQTNTTYLAGLVSITRKDGLA